MSPTTIDIESQKATAAKLLEGFSLATMQLTAETMTVTDEESYGECVGLMGKFGEAEKKIIDYWDGTPQKPGIVRVAHTLHAMLTKARGEMAKPYQVGKDLLRRKCEAYQDECRAAKRRAEQQLAIAAEQERRRLEDQARDLIAQGYVAKAEQVERQAGMTVAPVLPAAVSKVAGARSGIEYKATVIDPMALIKSIAAGKTPLMWNVKGEEKPLIVVDESVLRALAMRFQDSLNLPGVTCEEKSRVTSSGRTA